MELWLGAVTLGFLYSFLAMGAFLTFRVLDFPDITVDGSFTAGAAATAVLLVAGVHPLPALAAGFGVGLAAGTVTALVHNGFKISGLLSGILVMTALYSVNLHIMGRSNIPLLNQASLFTLMDQFNPGVHPELWNLAWLSGVMAVFWAACAVFLRTDLGLALRSTGNNPIMASAAGIDVPRMKVLGIALANGLSGLAGGLVAQYQGFADIGMGIGCLIIGLASVIIGETLVRRATVAAQVAGVIVGAVVFRWMVAGALEAGLDPIDLKLLIALFVLITLVVSRKLAGRGKEKALKRAWLLPGWPARRWWTGAALLLLAGLAGWLGYRAWPVSQPTERRPARPERLVGVVQLTDNTLLDTTRDSFLQEMAKLGYRSGPDCRFEIRNAQGDLASVNSILDQFRQLDADVVVTISTACTQAAIHRIQDRPVIFASVANPFIIGAGSSDRDHLPNVTGTYGWVPMDRLLAMVRACRPGPIRIGCIWDPAQANSVFNVGSLRKAVEAHTGVVFEGVTISGSAEVYQAAQSLVSKGIDAFVLSTDNTVYSAFESVYKAAQSRNVPIFIADTERLKDGAVGVLGFDYTTSGIMAAHLADRVLRGESPAGIPFRPYRRLTIGVNLDQAKLLGLDVPRAVLDQATVVIGGGESTTSGFPTLGLVQFGDEPDVERCKAGILKALGDNGFSEGVNLEIIRRNAQSEFAAIPALMEDLVRRNVEVIMPLTSPCLQAAAKAVAGRPKPLVVFTYVYDPYRLGVARSAGDHPPNLTGVINFPPVGRMLDQLREILPDRRRLGVVWSPAQAGSEAVLRVVRAEASRRNVELLEGNADSAPEVLEAARALIRRGAQVLLNPGDNIVAVGFDGLLKAGRESRVPVFTVEGEQVERGALASLGVEYYQAGLEAGGYLARVLAGESPAGLPILESRGTLLAVNLEAARELGLSIPPAVVARADRVIGEAAEPPHDSGKQVRRLAIFRFNDHFFMTGATRGIVDELTEQGLAGPGGLQVEEFTAQGDFSLAQSIAQDLVRQRFDCLVTLSTPALQAVAKVNQSTPHVFGAVTDPYRTGIARSPAEHPAHLTGLATFEPIEASLRTMRRCFPSAKCIGLVWNPSELCSEACTEVARVQARKYGFRLEEATVQGSGEVLEAVRSLFGKGIDLFYTSGDNTVALAAPVVGKALREKKIPYFTNNPADIEAGALVTIGADHYRVGRETGKLAARVIRGEPPAGIPIREFLPEAIRVNRDLARELGVRLPGDLAGNAGKAVPQP